MPIYHLPEPRPPVPTRGIAPISSFRKLAAPTPDFSAAESSQAANPVLQVGLLAGASGALLLIAGFALTLLVVSLVWSSPHRTWFLCGLCTTYLAAAFTTGRALWRRWRTRRLPAEMRLQSTRETRIRTNYSNQTRASYRRTREAFDREIAWGANADRGAV